VYMVTLKWTIQKYTHFSPVAMVSAAMRRTRKVGHAEPSAYLQSASPSDVERVHALAALAREELKLYADIDEHLAARMGGSGQMNAAANKVVMRLGQVDGIGFLLKVASFDGNVQTFLQDGQLFLDSVVAATLNYMVIAMLCVTLFVSVALQHAGGLAYSVDAAMVGLNFRTDPAAADSGGAFADLATWVSSDPGTQVTARRILYCIECALIAVGFINCAIAFFESLFLFLIVSSALPSVLDKYEVLVQNVSKLSGPFRTSTIAYDMSIFVMVFIAARASAVLFLAMCAVFVAFNLYATQLTGTKGTLGQIFTAQHRSARRVLAAHHTGSSAADCGPMAAAGGAASSTAFGPATHLQAEGVDAQQRADGSEAALTALVARSLPAHSVPPDAIARELINEGFTLTTLRAAAAAKLDVASALSKVRASSGLRAGDCLALAAAVATSHLAV
jgi:hypothetical protein